MTDSVIALPEPECKAKDERGAYRQWHKPVLGLLNGQQVISCAWCGADIDNYFDYD